VQSFCPTAADVESTKNTKKTQNNNQPAEQNCRGNEQIETKQEEMIYSNDSTIRYPLVWLPK